MSAAPKAGYLVAVVRDGKPVFHEGFTAHTDTLAEAEQVVDAWKRFERTVVFELVEVAP